MEFFRNLKTNRVRRAEPGSVRHALMSRSERYEAVDAELEPALSPDALDTHTIADLREMAAAYEIEVPAGARKGEIITLLSEQEPY